MTPGFIPRETDVPPKEDSSMKCAEPNRVCPATILVALFCALAIHARPAAAKTGAQSLGVFAAQADVGSVAPPGKLEYNPATGVYTIRSAGANLWMKTDAFHFVWKKISGDVSLTADIEFPDKSGNPNPHRKALVMFRQTLDEDSVYVDAAQHGVGLTALQYRPAKGATTHDIELNIDPPKRLRLEKRGDVFTMFLSNHGEPLHQTGASIKLHLQEPFYVGIGVCSHNKDVVEAATFSNLELKRLTPPKESAQMALYSTLQTIGLDADSPRSTVVSSLRGHMEAPNWSRDGNSLIYNQDGHVWTIPAAGGEARMIDIGAAMRCTGSHGLSPDGKWLAISCAMPDRPETRVYVVPSDGGSPRLVTQNPNSYFHSWSPNGKTILFTRPDHGSNNIHAISVEGGEEKALTSGSGISDDPDYSPDGQFIYFNSDRGGTMQVWRMRPDGSAPEQMTHDDMNNWTPHPSPDGKSIVILSYLKEITGHPANKDVILRLLTPDDGKIRALVNIVGGSGTDNVPNWAPDGQHFAFVSYQMLPAEDTGSTQ
jgi:TolB protein